MTTRLSKLNDNINQLKKQTKKTDLTKTIIHESLIQLSFLFYFCAFKQINNQQTIHSSIPFSTKKPSMKQKENKTHIHPSKMKKKTQDPDHKTHF